MHKKLKLIMQPRWLLPNPRIDAIRDSVALQCGPLIYCVEQQDQPAGVNLLDVVVDDRNQPEAQWQPDLLGGIMTLQIQAAQRDLAAWADELYLPAEDVHEKTSDIVLRAIPYFRWGNRGLSGMRIWLPLRHR